MPISLALRRVLAWLAVLAVFAAILATVPLGHLVSQTLYRLTPETVEEAVPVPGDPVDVADLPRGALVLDRDGSLRWVPARGEVVTVPLPGPCRQLGYRKGLLATCALDAGLALVDASAEGRPAVRLALEGERVVSAGLGGTRIAAGLEDGTVIFLDLEGGETVERARHRLGGPAPVRVVSRGDTALVGQGSELVGVRLAPDGSTREAFRVGLGDPVAAVDYIAELGLVAAGARLVQLDLDAPGGPAILVDRAAPGPVTDLARPLSTVTWVFVEGHPARILRDSRVGVWWWSTPGGPVSQARTCWARTGKLTCLGPDGSLQRMGLAPTRDAAIYGVGALAGLAILGGLLALVLLRPPAWPEQLAWTAGCLGVLGWLLSGSFHIPIEALHILEYALLGLLAYRALALGGHGGASTAALAVLVGLTAGLADESIQWWHPARTGAFDDVWLDTRAAAIGAVLGWQGVRFWPGRPVAWAWVPGVGAVLLVWVVGFQQVTAGFGGRYTEEGLTWNSRLSPEEVRRIDASADDGPRQALVRGAAMPYDDFLRAYRDDPFLYELRVHLFRRDVRLSRGDVAVACAEERLIQRLYPRTVAGTPFAWGPSQAARCAQVPDEAYTSPVSGELITWIRPWQAWAGGGGLALALLALSAGLAWRQRGLARRQEPVSLG